MAASLTGSSKPANLDLRISIAELNCDSMRRSILLERFPRHRGCGESRIVGGCGKRKMQLGCAAAEKCGCFRCRTG